MNGNSTYELVAHSSKDFRVSENFFSFIPMLNILMWMFLFAILAVANWPLMCHAG